MTKFVVVISYKQPCKILEMMRKMLKISALCCVIVSLMFFDSVRSDVEGTRKLLKQDLKSIKKQDVDNFNLPSKPQNVLQRDSRLTKMSEEERRKFEECAFETIVGICKEQNIIPCHHEDVKFFASLLAKGDKDCVLTCSEDKMLKNQDKMPHGGKTFDFIVAIEEYFSKLEPENDEDQKQIEKAFDSGCKAVGNNNCAENASRRFPFLAFIPAIIGLVKLGGVAAAGYISNMSNKKETKYLAATSTASRTYIRVAKASSRKCFSADSRINVLSDTGNVVQKLLRDINLGDMVESVDEETGRQTFSRVYYIAHEQDDSRSQLLRIHYTDCFNTTQFLGISDRHLMYVTKNGQSTAHAPLNEPMMAMQVEEGDVIWIMEEGSLVPRKVTGVMTYYSAARHPLTENHHVVVDGVHASVHILNEQLYRGLTYPLRWTFWANPEWNSSWLVKKLVRVVENGKEPFFASGPAELMEYWTGSRFTGLFSSPVTN